MTQVISLKRTRKGRKCDEILARGGNVRKIEGLDVKMEDGKEYIQNEGCKGRRK